MGVVSQAPSASVASSFVHSALSGPQHRAAPSGRGGGGEGLAAARAALAQARVCPGPLWWPPGARDLEGAQVREAERRRGFCFPAPG